MINPQWLELHMSRTNFHGPQYVRVNEVRRQTIPYYTGFHTVVGRVNYVIQSTLVISNPLISNNRLSRSENLVPGLTQRSTNRQQNIVEKRRNCS